MVMSEEQYIIDAIWGKKQIAIWGTGNTSKNFLNVTNWLLQTNMCFLDNNTINQEKKFYGKNIFCPSEIINWDDLFIIVCSAYYDEIKNQLSEMGLKEEMDFIVYNRFAIHMLERISQHNEREYLKKVIYSWRNPFRLEDLEEKVLKSDVEHVVFGLENVLLLGNIEYAYRLIGEKYHISSFNRIRNYANMCTCYQRKKQICRLNDIYEYITAQMGMSDDIAAKVKKAEIDLWKKTVKLRNSILEIYKYALQNKRVSFVSRLPYDVEDIAEVLNEYDIRFESLYMEYDYGNELWDVITKEKRKFIFIGNNYISEMENSQKYDFQFFYIPSPRETMSLATNLSVSMKMDMYSERDNATLYDYVINKIFDNPFLDYDIESMVNGNIDNFIKIYLLPTIIEFMVWMLQQVNSDGVNELLLVYRDGYLPQRLFDEIEKYSRLNFKCKKIYLSRTIRYCGKYKSKFPLIEALSHLPVSGMMTISDFVTSRLLVSDADKEEVLELIEKKVGKKSSDVVMNLLEIMSEYSVLNEKFKENAERKSEYVKAYCESIIDSSCIVGIFDIGYRGAVSDFLYELLDLKTQGYHMFKTASVAESTYGYETTKGFIHYGGNLQVELNEIKQLFEAVISKQEGTALGIDENINVNKEEFVKTNEWICYIQEELISLASEYFKMYGEYLDVLSFDQYNDFNRIIDLIKEPYKKDKDFFEMLLNNIDFQDSIFITKKRT